VPPPDLTRWLTDLNRGPDQAEAPASPTASAPGRAEEDSAPADPARSAGPSEDAAAAAQKGAGYAGVSGPRVWSGFGIEFVRF